jgi:hypothetical protein
MSLSTLFFGPGSRMRRMLSVTKTVRRRQPQLNLEALEARDLKTVGVPGVSLANGMLSITGTQFSGNTAAVSIDPTNQMVKVTLNGASQEFAPSLVAAVFYNGGYGGGDTFANSTNIMAIEYGWGGHNNFTGGSGDDYMFLWGDDNTVTDTGGVAVAYTHGGRGDNIANGFLVF